MDITKHARKRLRQRLGSFSESFIDKVEQLGKTHRDFSGSFRRYLDRQAIIHKCHPLVYGQFIYWCNKGKLVTVIEVPKDYRKAAL